MNCKKFISAAGISIVIAMAIIGDTGCANIVPPQGGPRDSLPPVLVKADPGDSTRNFTGNKITFTFDEFVDLQNIQEQLMVSPLPKTNPTIEYKLKTVTVKLKDSLEENITYTINFGEAIRDFAEGNVMKNFTYTFSTGQYIDSLQLSGSVVLAETGRPDSTLIVMLHTSADDSAVVKDKPRYITKLDSTGKFTFKNLPAKTFYIYALKDPGNIKRYQNGKQLFAFADKPVAVSSDNKPVTLYAYVAQKEKQAATPSGLQSIKPRAGLSEKRLKISNNLSNGQQDLLGHFELLFDLPLKSFDTARIKLYTDSTFNPAENYSFKKDSSGKKIKLDIAWKEKTLYHIVMDKDFAEDSTGKKLLKEDTLSFTTKRKADYGSLKLKIRNLDVTKNPVLQIFINGNLYKSAPMTGTEYSNPMLLPGEYELRILFDENKNGEWDPGDFFGKHKQPEIVKPIERKITVKPNWQNEFEIAL
jgi:Bacterial Ig-like domain